MVERRSPKPLVGGSSPSCPAITNFWKRYIMKEKAKKKSFDIKALIEYIKEAKAELDKVIFPTPNEVKQSFISVVAVVTVVTLFLGLVDLIMSGILKAVL
jgi:preprotein translocase subunit SecE